jgi:AraC family transcriptional regulator
MQTFEVTELTAAPFAYVTKTAPLKGIAEVMGQSFAELGKAFATAQAPMAGPPLCHYVAVDGQSTTFQVGFPFRPEDGERLQATGLTLGTTQGGTAMKATHIGPYETVAQTYSAMQTEMTARKLVGAEHMWEIYMSPPETPPEQIVTEVIWPVSTAP